MNISLSRAPAAARVRSVANSTHVRCVNIRGGWSNPESRNPTRAVRERYCAPGVNCYASPMNGLLYPTRRHTLLMTTQATDRGSPVMKKLEEPGSRFSEYDAYLFKQGSHTRLHDKLGAHLAREGEVSGVYFSVWAPECPLGVGDGRFQRVASGCESAAPARGRLGDLGRIRRRSKRRRLLQVSHRIALPRLRNRQERPLRLLLRGAAADRLARVAPRLRLVGRRVDAAAAAAPTRSMRPFPSTRFIWAPGAATRAGRRSR